LALVNNTEIEIKNGGFQINKYQIARLNKLGIIQNMKEEDIKNVL
jgi:hypothetical protein